MTHRTLSQPSPHSEVLATTGSPSEATATATGTGPRGGPTTGERPRRAAAPAPRHKTRQGEGMSVKRDGARQPSHADSRGCGDAAWTLHVSTCARACARVSFAIWSGRWLACAIGRARARVLGVASGALARGLVHWRGVGCLGVASCALARRRVPWRGVWCLGVASGAMARGLVPWRGVGCLGEGSGALARGWVP